MDKFFAIFGKVVLVAALLGGVAYGAYTFGRQGFAGTPSTADKTTTSQTSTQITLDSTVSAEITPTKKPTKTVTAGVAASAQLSFSKYQITVLDGWAYTNDTTAGDSPTDTLTITKNGYQIKIYQAATGGAMCIYPEDAPFEGPSSTYDEYVDITTVGSLKLRRSHTTGATTYTICSRGSEGLYGQPTSLDTYPTKPQQMLTSQLSQRWM
jgi:hypothetical protein